LERLSFGDTKESFMTVPEKSIADVNKLSIANQAQSIQSRPQVIGFSATADGVMGYSDSDAGGAAGVSGIASKGAAGVLGVSQLNDGVRGTSAAAGFSGVTGIHTGGGNGLYGKSGSGWAGYLDGNACVAGVLTVNGDIQLPGADCAEQFNSAGEQSIEPGMVVVIDEESGGLRVSSSEYDCKVAGVVAGAGVFRPGILLDSSPSEGYRLKVSLMGKVYCKADARQAAIQVGDLLTSSDNPGHAMRATDREKAFGAVIGKALGALPSGEGLIPILLALQ
jgi:hypothetical protein